MPGSFGFCGPTYQHRSGLWAYERCVNWYPAPDQSGHAQSKVAMLGVPGLSVFTTLPKGPVRGLWAGEERLFAVGGDTLYEIQSDGTVGTEGTLLGATTPVQISGNGNSLFIVDGDQGYLADGSGTVTPVVSAVSGDFLDGYYIALTPNSNEIALSNLFDGSTWDPLDTQIRTTGLDRMQRIFVHNGQVWLLGSKTSDVWYNSGDAGFPFTRINGASSSFGIAAPWSIASDGARLFWLSSTQRGFGRVVMANGYQPVAISTESIEYLIEQIRLSAGIYDAVGYCYEEDGHTFYVLDFPAGGWTVAYDATTQLWHERLRWDSGTSLWKQWHGGGFHAAVFGKHLVANIGYNAGVIYQQALDIYGDDGAAIRRLRIAPYVAQNHRWIAHHELKFYVQGTPTLKVSYSDDEGGTWSTPRSVTAANKMANVRRLGKSRDRLYQVTVDDSSQPVNVVDVYLDASAADEKL